VCRAEAHFASNYKRQGKLDKAEEMYQQALQGKEKALGPHHKSTLTTVNNLGSLYANQGKLDKAEEMYRRALEGYNKRFGSNHPRCCNSMRGEAAFAKHYMPHRPYCESSWSSETRPQHSSLSFSSLIDNWQRRGFEAFQPFPYRQLFLIYAH
jgi:tetratricopeptide (TPR) repeat protein